MKLQQEDGFRHSVTNHSKDPEDDLVEYCSSCNRIVNNEVCYCCRECSDDGNEDNEFMCYECMLEHRDANDGLEAHIDRVKW